MSPEMQRQLTRISFPEVLAREAQVAVHKEAEGFSETQLGSVRSMAELMLTQVINADQAVRAATEQHGDFKFKQYSYTYKNNLHVCEPTPFPAKIIEAARDALDETYGPIWAERTAVIDTQDCLQSEEETDRAISILRQNANSDSESFIFVNWNKKDDSEVAEKRRAKIENALFNTANRSPVHIVVVPSNQSPLFADAFPIEAPATVREPAKLNQQVVPA